MMDTREAVARALAYQDSAIDDRKRYADEVWEEYLDAADAAITAHLKALADAGYVVVPREPTEAMLDAGFAARSKFGEAYIIEGFEADIYRAMIAASPQPVADHPADQRGGE